MTKWTYFQSGHSRLIRLTCRNLRFLRPKGWVALWSQADETGPRSGLTIPWRSRPGGVIGIWVIGICCWRLRSDPAVGRPGIPAGANATAPRRPHACRHTAPPGRRKYLAHRPRVSRAKRLKLGGGPPIGPRRSAGGPRSPRRRPARRPTSRAGWRAGDAAMTRCRESGNGRPVAGGLWAVAGHNPR